MTGVHIIALVSALITVSVILELSRRRQLREKYALMWLAICVVVAAIAIAPGVFNHLAHDMGVINPPDLLTVAATLFLLVICVHLTWELGRTEEKIRTLAEEVTLLRNDLETSGDRSSSQRHSEQRSDRGRVVANAARVAGQYDDRPDDRGEPDDAGRRRPAPR